MNKPTKAFFLLVAVTLLWYTIALQVNSCTYIEVVKEQSVTENFHQGIAEITVKDQKRELTIKDETIKQLEVAVLNLKDVDDFNDMAYEDMLEMLEYCLLYIQTMQVRMSQNGLDYPAFILDSVLIQILEEGIKE